MLALMIAAALLQAPAARPPDPCFVGAPEAAPETCPRWRPVRLVRAITDASGYVDPASARREGNSVELNTLPVLREPIHGLSRLVARARLDCTARTILALHMTAFDAAGVQLTDRPVVDEQPEPVLASSPFAGILDEYCAR